MQCTIRVHDGVKRFTEREELQGPRRDRHGPGVTDPNPQSPHHPHISRRLLNPFWTLMGLPTSFWCTSQTECLDCPQHQKIKITADPTRLTPHGSPLLALSLLPRPALPFQSLPELCLLLAPLLLQPRLPVSAPFAPEDFGLMSNSLFILFIYLGGGGGQA